MLHKKLRKLLLTILISTLIFITIKFAITLNNNFNKLLKTLTPIKITQSQQIDTTKFTIQQILNTNKLQSLECKVSISIEDNRYDKVNWNWLNKISKLLTSQSLELQSDYKGLFTYDLSKAQFTKNNNTYNIALNSNDLELNIVQVDDIKTKEMQSLLGQYYNSQETSDLITQMQNMAKERINTSYNKDKALLNTKDDLINLFTKVGIDISTVNINTK